MIFGFKELKFRAGWGGQGGEDLTLTWVRSSEFTKIFSAVTFP